MSRSSLKNVSRLLDDAVKVSPIETNFIEDLKRSIELDSVKGWRKPSQTFKPSSMQCMRNSYYQIMGVEPDKGESSYNSMGIVNSGSDIHERTQQAITRMEDNGMKCKWIDVGEFVTKRELKDIVVREKLGMETKLFNSKYNISFMCDGIITYKNKYYIVEIKTETSSKFYARQGVDPKHYNQATAYSLSLGLDDVIFIYISRDMLEMKSFMYTVTDKMRRELVKYITDVQEYVNRAIAPPKQKDLPKNVCTYCPYKSNCRRTG